MEQIVISSSKDVKKISDAVNKIVTKQYGLMEKKGYSVLKTVAQRVAMSWRARAARGKYSSHGTKHGPHTRSGGVPLESSIKVKKISRMSFGIYVIDSGGKARADSVPSKYANYYRGRHGTYRDYRPYSYKYKAIAYGLRTLKTLLKTRR